MAELIEHGKAEKRMALVHSNGGNGVKIYSRGPPISCLSGSGKEPDLICGAPTFGTPSMVLDVHSLHKFVPLGCFVA